MSKSLILLFLLLFMQHGFRHAFHNLLNDFDWFLKADDDTYVIMENLHKLLYPHDPNEPIHFGCSFQKTEEEVCYRKLRREVEKGLRISTCFTVHFRLLKGVVFCYLEEWMLLNCKNLSIIGNFCWIAE